jgi:predicted nucleic acid-binding protein
MIYSQNTHETGRRRKLVSESFVLDSFALLAFLGGEPGSDTVADLLRQAQRDETRLLMTWVNIGEVAYIVERRWGMGHLHSALAMVEATALEIVPIQRDLALMAAHIKAEYAIALADTFAAALAQHAGATLVTGDPEFKQLDNILNIHWLAQGGH